MNDYALFHNDPANPADQSEVGAAGEPPIPHWRRRLTALSNRLTRSPAAKGFGLWAALLAVAYLVGTLAIAPMIGEAAGIGPGIYSFSPPVPDSQRRPEPAILITPIPVPRPAAPVAAVAAPKPEHKEHRRHHRHHRHSVPADETYLAPRNGSGEGDESPDGGARQRDQEEPESGRRESGRGHRHELDGEGVQRGRGLGDE